MFVVDGQTIIKVLLLQQCIPSYLPNEKLA